MHNEQGMRTWARTLWTRRIKRTDEAPAADDGLRVLVDALRPRGVSRAQLALDDWARELAPSAELRRWFAHDPTRFQEFRARYRSELVSRELALERLRRRAAAGILTLVCAARDQQHKVRREHFVRDIEIATGQHLVHEPTHDGPIFVRTRARLPLPDTAAASPRWRASVEGPPEVRTPVVDNVW